MSYIDLINSFWDSATTNPLSTGQVSLYFALLHVCNRSNWIEWFAAPNQVLSVLTGLSRSGILRARNELKQRGLIDFRERGTKATTYRIISTIANSTQVSTRNCAQNCTQNSAQDGTQKSNTLKDTDKDIDKKSMSDDIPERPARQPVDYKAVADLYNTVCVSLRKVQSLSDKRKKAIRARMANGRTMDDFRRLFEMAEGSSFLRGENNRNWSADFDWLISDANMAKVLDGKYEDKRHGKAGEADAQERGSTADYYRRYLGDSDGGDGQKLPGE